MTRRVLTLACALSLAGCAGCTTEPESSPLDGGADGRGTEDLGPLPDNLTYPDLGVPAVCEKTCLQQALHLCLTDPSDPQKQCVECLQDIHCTSNPGALGSLCDTLSHFCICTKDSDCASNHRGKRCDTSEKMCICKSNADCGPLFPVCIGWGASKVCSRPCLSDSHCTSPSAPHCDIQSGGCVACRAGTNDCAAHPSGTVCSGGRCTCSDTAGCSASSAWGSLCGTAASGRRCGCTKDSHCKDNAHGPTCDTTYKKCSCTADTDCKVSPYNRCSAPYAGAPFDYCQKACISAKDCADRIGLPLCVQGRCVACTADKDCTTSSQPHCDTARGLCVACTEDTHCSSDLPRCSDKTGTCVQCTGSTDCAKAGGGALCVSGTCGCTTVNDCTGSDTWGPLCLSSHGRCGCSLGADCKSKPLGPTCDTTFSKCSCTADADCKIGSHTKCALPYKGASYKTCRIPCTGDADCAARSGLKRCDTQTGLCVPCLTDTDCSANQFATLCDTSSTQSGCVECIKSSDCTQSSLGNLCSATLCTCTADKDCSGNLNGHRCDKSLGICSCASVSDCPSGKSCSLLPGYSFYSCQ